RGTAGDRRHDRDLVVGVDLGVEAVDVADVLVVDVDVDEAAHLGAVEQLLLQPGVGLGQVAEHLADRVTAGLDLGLAVGVLAEHGGDADDGHGDEPRKTVGNGGSAAGAGRASGRAWRPTAYPRHGWWPGLPEATPPPPRS